MAELADVPDLGSGVHDVQVQVLLSALESPYLNPHMKNILSADLSAGNRMGCCVRKEIPLLCSLLGRQVE